MKTNMLNKVPMMPGTCEWCGKDCEVRDVACSLSCEALLARLEAVQGQRVLRMLKLWRKHRGAKDTPGQGTLTEVASAIDGFLRTDRLRREEAGHKRRQKALADKVAPATVAPSPPVQTAAPLIDQPGQTEVER